MEVSLSKKIYVLFAVGLFTFAGKVPMVEPLSEKSNHSMVAMRQQITGRR